MRTSKSVSIVAFIVLLGWQTNAQIYDTNGVVVQTFAGSAFYGYVDGVGQQTMFYYPTKIVSDSSGNLFVWDGGNSRIRRITTNAIVSTFAGGGTAIPGVGTDAALDLGTGVGMAIDHNDTIWINAPSTSFLYRISKNATVTRISLPISFSLYYGICVDSVGNVYLSHGSNNKIYRYATNAVLEVFAGSGNPGSVDGNGMFTSFSYPLTLAADEADNIYVWDAGNQLIRRINQNRDVVTVAGHLAGTGQADGFGTNAIFSSISAMCADESGNLYLACYSVGSSIRRMTPATNVTTLAGSFTQAGFENGPGNLARFNGYYGLGVCISDGKIYVADSGNHRIRSITYNPTNQPVLPAELELNTYPGLRIVGTVGRSYRIESSPDTTNWTTRATLLLNASPYLWIDQNPVSGSKFYRAFLLP